MNGKPAVQENIADGFDSADPAAVAGIFQGFHDK